jgi:hypothetical protein
VASDGSGGGAGGRRSNAPESSARDGLYTDFVNAMAEVISNTDSDPRGDPTFRLVGVVDVPIDGPESRPGEHPRKYA